MLNFAELPADGIAFEQLVRDVAFSIGYRVTWTGGGGADGGRDLLIEEVGDLALGGKVRRWLVSCKHTAHANGGKGRAVGKNDIEADGGIRDLCAEHGADGFLLVCSTVPTAAVTTRLEKLGARGEPHTHIWDGVQIERMLQAPKQWALAQGYMPISAEASGWRVWATERPNHFVAATRGYYLQLHNRHMSALGYQLSSIDDRLDALEALELPEGHQVRLRAMWCDDKHGTFTWYADYLCPRTRESKGCEVEPPWTMPQLEKMLGSGTVLYSDGQIDEWDIELEPYWPHSDWWDPNHYDYYDKHAGTFAVGMRRTDRW